MLIASCSSSAPRPSELGSSPSAAAAAPSPLLRARLALPGLLHPPRQENLRDPDAPQLNVQAPELSLPSSVHRCCLPGDSEFLLQGVGVGVAGTLSLPLLKLLTPGGAGEQPQTQLLLPLDPQVAHPHSHLCPAALGGTWLREGQQ